MDDAATLTIEMNEIRNEVVSALAPIVEKEMNRLLREAIGRRYGARAPKVERRESMKRLLAPAATPVPARAPKPGARDAFTLEDIKAALAKAGKPLRSQALRKALGISDKARRRLATMLRTATRSGQITRRGQKKATTYSLKK